jgi:hypothetical protein
VVTEKTRKEDERLREELRHADIGKLKKLMGPLIEERRPPQKRKRPRRKP